MNAQDLTMQDSIVLIFTSRKKRKEFHKDLVSQSNTLYFFGFLVNLVFLALGFIHLPQRIAGET